LRPHLRGAPGQRGALAPGRARSARRRPGARPGGGDAMSGRLSGMTGFARVEGALDDWSWAIEARSVNGRNLEVRFRAPPGFESLDRIVREAAQARLQRGQVSVHLQARRAERAAAPQVNTPVLETYLALARDL